MKIVKMYALFAFAASCAFGAAQKPNLVFMMSDQWRGQAVGFAKEDPVQTPNTDKLAASGVFFRNATCNSPICAPNRSTIFTGTYISSNGVINNERGLKTNYPTLFGALKEGGYKVAYIGKWHLDLGGGHIGLIPAERRFGIDYFLNCTAGHKHFSLQYALNDEEPVDYGAGWQPEFEVTKGIEWIAKNDKEPFALFLSFAPPHTGGGKGFEGRHKPYDIKAINPKGGYGYAAPAEYEAMYKPEEKFIVRPNATFENEDPARASLKEGVAGYFGAITSIDHEMGRMIDFLEKQGLLKNTIIVITADHGEMMGSQKHITKGIWFEESLRVPLVFYWDGKLKVQDNPASISSVDITPTLTDLMGLKELPTARGHSFAKTLLEGAPSPADASYFSFYGGDSSPRHFRGLRTARYTYVLPQYGSAYGNYNQKGDLPYGVLYDNEKDPYQMKPLFYGDSSEADAVMKELHAKLAAFLKSENDDYINSIWKVPPVSKANIAKKTRDEERAKKRVEAKDGKQAQDASAKPAPKKKTAGADDSE